MVFEEIKTEEDLIAYLDNVSDRLKKRKYIFHYTSIDKCAKIFTSKLWYLSAAGCMYDQLEFNNGDPDIWNNLFFASFMSDADESIGMWSMYSQPWENGVQIAIPVSQAKKWIQNVSCIKEISCSDFKPTGKMIKCDKNNKVFFSSVAYTNCDNHSDKQDKLMWSTAKNIHFPMASHNHLLTGYVKDAAWEYEKEIRIKAVLDNQENFSKVAIDIPDDVLDSIIITASPLFNGDLRLRLESEIKRNYSTQKSIFTGRLNITSICNQCQKRTGLYSTN